MTTEPYQQLNKDEDRLVNYRKKKMKKNPIKINPANKGKFTATKKATGKTTAELANSPNPLTRKRANFARMAKRGFKPLSKGGMAGEDHYKASGCGRY